MKTLNITLIGTLAGVAALLAAGCATTDTDAVRVEDDFGSSVRQMVNAQVYDPQAAKTSGTEPPLGLDGVQGEAVLDTYRAHIGNPKEVSKQIRIDVSR